MAGKGGKGLVAAKTMASNKDKDKGKMKPISRSARAGIQVIPSSLKPLASLVSLDSNPLVCLRVFSLVI